MRRIAWISLVVLVFAIPWEYSLDLGAPFGNVARILGLISCLLTGMAVLQAGGARRFSRLHFLTLALYAWLCCSYFWTLTPGGTLAHLRGYAQEMMLLWLVWEFVEDLSDLRVLLWSWLAGSWVLAVLTIGAFAAAGRWGVEQIRFAAVGQDPNDVARYLNFGFPIAGLLLVQGKRWLQYVAAFGYIAVAFAAVLLTASRSGFLIATVALAGCGLIVLRRSRHRTAIGFLALVSSAAFVLIAAPPGTLQRLGTMREVWRNPDLNQRMNIWLHGWRAFERAPMLGYGAGSFVTAAEVASEDTAHNSALAIMVESGLCGLMLASAIVMTVVSGIHRTRGSLRPGLSVLMIVWGLSAFVGTVGENRMTWLLFGVSAAGERLSCEAPDEITDEIGTTGGGINRNWQECLR